MVSEENPHELNVAGLDGDETSLKSMLLILMMTYIVDHSRYN